MELVWDAGVLIKITQYQWHDKQAVHVWRECHNTLGGNAERQNVAVVDARHLPRHGLSSLGLASLADPASAGAGEQWALMLPRPTGSGTIRLQRMYTTVQYYAERR